MNFRILLFCIGIICCVDGLAMNPASSNEWTTVTNNKKKHSVNQQYLGKNFLKACAFGNVAQVQNILQHDRIDINGRSKEGFTPLTTAIFNGQNNMVAELINAGADVNKCNKDEKGMPPLTVAVTKRNFEVASKLLMHSAIVDGSDSQGSTPLMYAAAAVDLPMIELLLKNKAKVNAQDFEKLRTPLHWALRMYENSRQKRGMLHSAQEILPVIKILLENKANPTIRDKTGQSPIEWAHYLYFTAAEKLMRESVNINR